MDVFRTEQARAVEDRLYDERGHAYDRLWDVLDRILADPEEAQHSGWATYVSTLRMFGSKIPGTDYYVFWRIEGDTLQVLEIRADIGI